MLQTALNESSNGSSYSFSVFESVRSPTTVDKVILVNLSDQKLFFSGLLTPTFSFIESSRQTVMKKCSDVCR